ncbi:MAG: antibiotic biosynthesis monooxygenase [Segetibacter sp.]
MITRIWHGKTKVEHADMYLNYIEETGIKDYRNIRGNLSAMILRRIEDNISHFWTITKWDNMESIKKFASNDYEKARYYPEDEKYLLEFEENVTHLETFEY